MEETVSKSLGGHKYPDNKTRQKHYKKRKIQINRIHEYRYKNATKYYPIEFINIQKDNTS